MRNPAPQTVPRLARFVAFHESAEAGSFRDGALAFAVVIARGADGVVLVFNRFRDLWELPGGLIDPGEGPRDAALRELREEANCEALSVRWLGITEVDDGRRHFGGVFSCDVEVAGFAANDEIGARMFWRADQSPDRIGDTDKALLERFGR